MGSGSSSAASSALKDTSDKDLDDFFCQMTPDWREKLKCACLAVETEKDQSEVILQAEPDVKEKPATEVEMSLPEWYKKAYKQGGKFTMEGYLLDLPQNAFYHKDSGITIWREAIDVSGDAEDFVVLFHYTNSLAFSNITNTANAASEVRASLVTEGAGANAWYGQGVYCSQNGPDQWNSKNDREILDRILDNNFRRMLKRDIESMGADEAFKMYADRVKFCVPIFVDPKQAYNTTVRCTPEMEEHGHGPGKNIKGQPLNEPGLPTRDCWVVRLENDDNDIQAAGAKLVETLKLRWQRAADMYGADDIDTWHCASRYAYVLRDRSQLKQAGEVYRAVLEGYEKCLGPKALDVMTAQGNLALTLKELGQHKEAEELYRKSILLHEEVEGPNVRTTRVVKSNLACLLRAMGGGEEAQRLYKDAYDGDEAEFGKDHPTTLVSLNNWAGLLKDEKKYDEAEPLFRQAVEGLAKKNGPTHPRVLVAVSNWAGCLRKLKKYDDAKPLYEQALKGHEAVLGPDHMSTLTDYSNLAGLLEDMEKLEEAEPYYRHAYEGFKKTLGPTHGNTLVVGNNLGLLASKLEKNLEAAVLYREAIAGLEQLHDPEHPQCINAYCNLAALLAWNKEFDLKDRQEALELYKRCAVSFEKRFGADDEDAKDCKECITDLQEEIEQEMKEMK
mmetsp:Transcript_12054/g.21398  ORF Transcript_12054/g.21398 Transcript_12054/m.21398 type:complete len:673 (-) Transcript_12054:172-2190(-)|eukprot:CAMPEP_0197624430 /NCGR_PEP_ID=MMETSP1338-20131121/4067_1 /TAXON_ID=43686 ORGANISM="Pelagodinium beii, Strain RCC1491" /NCGR_SAMPLE_ID=MMETSP1338 /ASSEMBLY_ACC=CAM_ASM_000754 /LENGTH=672 /DNA_ID=CAMNT_0043194567 /DNA_START=62 /DNA_END=2080 /DNA_ORIENTATION=-